ncbi:indolepyruvate ferredoxin oxidoreductase subunit alpha [Treponema sp.]|uniref:indolepyruvate ferredoxin oxidoreductase subunit alpha n=1 Tax=Treponema sp. TaxID=166 RepID=UPI00257E4C33|nr:indolepyruvate ferredoxin oxidoreductase subunit alpha [Treponema sp.]MBE6354769.1 indolepyruvate ferredoxin oxidoreductase subunit alpha [Treponema sp.]
MKQLMLGNAAAARGLYEAGCEFISSYPGTPSTEITEEAAKFKELYCEWAPNEKVAMESAFGACLAGRRAFCGMKHVGLNVAADPLYTMSYTGVNAGLVIGVADDPGMHSSQNEQDSRHHAIAAKVPMIEPSDSEDARNFAALAFELSEKFDTPVLYKMCTRVAHSQSITDTAERKVPEHKAYEKNIQKYVMAPANAIRRHPFVEQRMKDIEAWSETSGINRIEKASGSGSEKIFDVPASKIGIITSSTSYQYVKEVLGDSVNILKLGMVNPLPANMIRNFAKGLEALIIVEELDPIIEQFCRGLELGIKIYGKDILPICGEFSQNIVAAAFKKEIHSGKKLNINIPVRPPIMCAGCPHRGMFYALNKLKVTVFGDIGCYTLGSVAPLSAMDVTLCMGASFSGLHGWNKSTGADHEKKSVAVIGDSTFMHSGMTGLASIAYNQSNSTVIILDNSITGMTGHQQNPTTGKNLYGDPAGKVNLEALARAMGINRVRVVDPYNMAECEQAVKEEIEVEEPSLIISRRPCALLKEVKHNPPLVVDEAKCRSCKMCMKIGCPAIAMKNGKAKIDSTLCVGCGVCSQMCKFDALKGTSKN